MGGDASTPDESALVSSPDGAVALGAALGRALADGELLGLTGPLGAGKTQLTHGLVAGVFEARNASVDGLRVCSPSYTIVNTYARGAARVHHMDLYRLGSIDDLESTGYWDLVDELDAVCLVEWMTHIPESAPDHGWVELVLEIADVSRPDVSARRVSIRNHGDDEAYIRLRDALERWRATVG